MICRWVSNYACAVCFCDIFHIHILELFNLLINPVAHDFALRWHRDDVNEKATSEEEQEALNLWHFGVGLNIEVLSNHTHNCI